MQASHPANYSVLCRSITFGRPVLLPSSGIMDVSEALNIHEEVSDE